MQAGDFVTPDSISVGCLHFEHIISVRQMFIIDGMLSYGGVVPFLVKSNQTIGITYLGGIQIVEGRK